MKTFYWLIKRETWEHRSFYMVPLVIGGLALFFMLAGLVKFLTSAGAVAHASKYLHMNVVAPEFRFDAIAMGILSTSAPFTVVLFILVAVYLLDALYGDRRDRSILFWKSLPVSDTAVVLSKLVTAALVAPLITLAVVAVAQLGVLILASVGFMVTDVEGWGWLWNPLAWLYGWASLGYVYFLLALILMPYMGWLLLASSWARRAPFLWAAVPPVALMVLERWFLGTGYLAQWMFGHLDELTAGLEPICKDKAGDMHGHTPGDIQRDLGAIHDQGMLPGLEFFASPALWGGFLVAALFIAAAVYVRRYREET